ncbi:MAG: hypothetical protein ACQEWF_23100 [Bacillota bacterium]
MYRKKIVVGLVSLTFASIAFWTIDRHDAYSFEQVGNDVANISEENNNSSNISPENIYGTFESEYSWVKDPKLPENLIHEGITSIVHLKVLSMGEAEILPKKENFYNDTPYTPIEVEIVDTISGNPLSGKKTVYIQGGNIKISKLIESMDIQRSNKMGLNQLSQEKKDTMYITYSSDHDYKMEIGEEYVVILVNPAEDIYTVMANGYGIFDIEKTKSSKKIFKNVVTGKDSDFQFSNVKK